MKFPSPMRRATLSSRDFSTRVIRILMVNVTINTLNQLYNFLVYMHSLLRCSSSYLPNYPTGTLQSRPRQLVRLQSTIPTW